MLELFPCIDNVDDITGHHAIRIAAKKLRYVMEICNKPLNGRFADAIKKSRRIQTLLGEVHDCDVWAADISQFISDERNSAIKTSGHARALNFMIPGLEYLKSQKRAKRVKNFGLAKKMITKQIRSNYWPTLIDSLKVQGHKNDV